MKQLLSQNGIKVYSKLFKEFSCNNCGAVFMSDEYLEEHFDKNVFSDTCFTCNQICIIEEEKDGKDKSI